MKEQIFGILEMLLLAGVLAIISIVLRDRKWAGQNGTTAGRPAAGPCMAALPTATVSALKCAILLRTANTDLPRLRFGTPQSWAQSSCINSIFPLTTFTGILM
jgi:hypothetical protein